MSGAPGPATEAELLFEMIRRRYGDRLTPAQLAEVRLGVEAMVETARALRAVRLTNADEPLHVFHPYRADG